MCTLKVFKDKVLKHLADAKAKHERNKKEALAIVLAYDQVFFPHGYVCFHGFSC